LGILFHKCVCKIEFKKTKENWIFFFLTSKLSSNTIVFISKDNISKDKRINSRIKIANEWRLRCECWHPQEFCRTLKIGLCLSWGKQRHSSWASWLLHDVTSWANKFMLLWIVKREHSTIINAKINIMLKLNIKFEIISHIETFQKYLKNVSIEKWNIL